MPGIGFSWVYFLVGGGRFDSAYVQFAERVQSDGNRFPRNDRHSRVERAAEHDVTCQKAASTCTGESCSERYDTRKLPNDQ